MLSSLENRTYDSHVPCLISECGCRGCMWLVLQLVTDALNALRYSLLETEWVALIMLLALNQQELSRFHHESLKPTEAVASIKYFFHSECLQQLQCH